MTEISSVAVVGGGIAGLATAWLLSRRYSVTLFEREPELGGHAHTVTVQDALGPLGIDTGFVVYNERNYPLLTAFFDFFQVPTQDTDMSFSYALEPEGVVYAGTRLGTLFAQRRNLLRPRFLRMVVDILRFNRLSKRLLTEVPARDLLALSLGEFLEQHRFSRAFQEDYLLPMAAAIWSCPLATMRDFPVQPFLRFFLNHGLLDLSNRPQWRTVVGGSQAYVSRVKAALGSTRIVHQPVRSVHRDDRGWRIRTETQTETQTETGTGTEAGTKAETNGNTSLKYSEQVQREEFGSSGEMGERNGTDRTFDAVVLACHADESLALLESPDPDISAVLAACRFQANRAILHTDTALMPRLPQVWASWNYLAQRGGSTDSRVSVSYYMNQLHRFDSRRHYMISLNPWREPHPEAVLGEYQWQHPIMDQAALQAQAALPGLQGRRGLYLAGAWTGYGFHEDGIRSAVTVARSLGVVPPWAASTNRDASNIDQTLLDTSPTPARTGIAD